MYLYKIENKVNGKVYVGITNNTKRRWKEHRNELKGSRHINTHLQLAWNKYGENCFDFKIINKFNNLDDLNKAEIDYIAKYRLKNPKIGYNISSGGNSFSHSEKSKKNISKSNEISVIRKCLKTGEEKVYKRILDVKEDGFNPKSISNPCVGRLLTYKNNVWMYFDEYSKNPKELCRRFTEYKNTKSRPSRYRKVYGMNIKTLQIVEYKAIFHAKKDGFNNNTINMCCSRPDVYKTHKGYVWSFNKNELENKLKKIVEN